MKITIEDLEAMVTAGASAQVLLLAIKPAIEQLHELTELLAEREQRNRDLSRERMRQKRLRDVTRNNASRYANNGYSSLSFLTERVQQEDGTSVERKECVDGRGVGKPKRNGTVKIPLPVDWEPKSSHYELAFELHHWTPSTVNDRADWFRDQANAKDWRYKNWHSAFNNCIRDKWGCK